MRMMPIVAVLAVCATACSGSKNATSHPTPLPSPRAYQTVIISTIPPSHKKVTPLPTLAPNVTPAKLPTVRVFVPKSPTPFPPTDYKAVVYGRVMQVKTRKPIAGAKIVVADGQRSTTSDSHGKYRIAFPVKAAVSIQVVKKNWACGLAMGVLHAGQTYHKDWLCQTNTAQHPAPPPFPSTFGENP